MLRLTIESRELFDERTGIFVEEDAKVVEFEHSLLAVSKWESKYQIPFLDSRSSDKTEEQLFDYIRFMALTDLEDINLFDRITNDQLDKINKYINSKESATTFGEMPKTQTTRGEIITSELIYYWMVAFTIPFECERWNLNRLFALIKICNIKNSPDKKMSRHSVASRNREINAARRAQYNTPG